MSRSTASRFSRPRSRMDATRNHLIRNLTSSRLHDLRHRQGEQVPVRLLDGELPSARSGQPVELSAPPGVGDAPLGVDPGLYLDAVEGGVEGALLDEEEPV